MKEYKNCKYCTVEDVKTGKIPAVNESGMLFPNLIIVVSMGEIAIPLDTNISIEDICKDKYTEEELEAINKKMIDEFRETYTGR